MTMAAFSDYDSDAPSLNPSSSPTSDSEDESYCARSLDVAFRSSITSISESKLRSILIKLAGGNPQFQRAIMKELARADPAYSSSTAPTNRKVRSRWSQARLNRGGLLVGTRFPLLYKTESTSPPSTSQGGKYVYHPGQLNEELYEFLSGTSDNVAFNSLKRVTMWSCCDEDELSPGCVVAPTSAIPLDDLRSRGSGIELSHANFFA